jgi:plastocyanin
MNNRYSQLITLTLIVSLFLSLAFLTGSGISCQSSAPGPGLPTGPSQEEPPVTPLGVEVAIEGFAFKPAILNIPVGTTVIWENEDNALHTVTARDSSFDSGSLSHNDTFSYTFEQSGTYEYYCQFHPHMEGKVVVD